MAYSRYVDRYARAGCRITAGLRRTRQFLAPRQPYPD